MFRALTLLIIRRSMS